MEQRLRVRRLDGLAKFMLDFLSSKSGRWTLPSHDASFLRKPALALDTQSHPRGRGCPGNSYPHSDWPAGLGSRTQWAEFSQEEEDGTRALNVLLFPNPEAHFGRFAAP